MGLVLIAWVLDLYARGLPVSPTGLLLLFRTAVSPWIVATLPLLAALVQFQSDALPTAGAPGAEGPWDGDALADGALEAMLLLDAGGAILAANVAAERMFGQAELDLVGRNIVDLLPSFTRDPSDLGRTRRTMDRVVLGVEWDFEAQHRSGRMFPVKASYVRTRMGLVVRLRSETQEARAARSADATLRKLRRAVDDAKEELRAKSEFIASMSHDLRTPLNAVIGYAEMLRDDVDDEVVRRDLARIERAGRYLLDLINNILDLSKIDAGKLTVVQENVGLGPLVDDVYDATLPVAESHANALITDVEPGLSLVRADPVRLRQVLINLVGNASKFTQGGEVRLVVRGHAVENRQGVLFEVVDTGPGMSDEHLSTLFQAYRTSELQRARGGTGLGLVITKHLVEAMKGTLSVESTLGEGSTFRVFLPAPALSRVTLVPSFAGLASVTRAPVPGSQHPDPAVAARALKAGAAPISIGDVVGEARSDAPTQMGVRAAIWYTGRSPRLALRVSERLSDQGWDVTPTESPERFDELADRATVLLIDLGTAGAWDLVYKHAERRPVVAVGVDADVSPALSVGAREVVVEPASAERWRTAMDRARLQSRPVVCVLPDGPVLDALRERYGHQVINAVDVDSLAELSPERPAVAVATDPELVEALRDVWLQLPVVVQAIGASAEDAPAAGTVLVKTDDEEGRAQVLHAVSIALDKD
ncbi:MAG: PAS domain S-box protein [Alphaproteobacteria bacterium]|nr:PAS domain S-box protein [Alphaproteobacteria bacterium]